MEETLYFGCVNILLRKGSPHLDRINSILSRMVSSGIPLLMETMVIRRSMSMAEQDTIRYSRDAPAPDITRLALKHVQGAFLLLAAILVAIIENVLSVVKRKRHSVPSSNCPF